MQRSRRDFLADVGRGMLMASVGPALASDLGMAPAWAGEAPPRLTFGKLEPLAALMQETPAEKLLPLLTEKLRAGTDLQQLVSAAALANARAFGGEDYVGFHTLMAIGPAYHMAREMPEAKRALPVFKVLYRNSRRIQESGHGKKDTLHPVAAVKPTEDKGGALALRDAVRRTKLNEAEGIYASLAAGSADKALNSILPTLCDGADVHRVVMVSRAWDLLDFVGKEQAHTMLRQSVHYCIKGESNVRWVARLQPMRDLLVKLLDQYKLVGKPFGKKTAEDAWVGRFSETLFRGTPDQAGEAVAAALAEGIDPRAIGEAISLGTNQLVLRDNGRPEGQTSPGKPVGSVHGDGIGVHACDSANAWRNLARVSSPDHAAACLILAGYQLALDRGERGGEFLKWEPYPRADAREKVTEKDADKLLAIADAAIRNKDQALACAAVQRYGQEGHPERPVFDLMLRYAVSEDGALHAEKFYRTVTEEFAGTRPAFRWRQLVALARITASEYGQPAPGYEEACKLLKV